MRRRTLVLAVWVAAAPALAEPSPCRGEEARALKALSPAEVDDLLAGRGMGLAKAAELNHYPGPAHVLELADQLGLTPEQRRATEALFARMQAAALALGTDLLAAERALDASFADGTATAESVTRATGEAGGLLARLRAVHLVAHVEMKALLTPAQIAQYDTLRGYASGAPTTGPGHQHHHPG
jgi:hypothetical protein